MEDLGLAERDQAILSMRNNRRTFSQIGKLFSISGSRARQIYLKQVRLQKENRETQETQEAWTDPLPLGFQRWFEDLGLCNKEAVFEAIKEGLIAERRNSEDRYSRVSPRNVLYEPANGWLRPCDMKLVVEWVGLDIRDYVLSKNDKELRRFLESVKSGASVGDAVLKHLCGPHGGKRRTVVNTIMALAALEPRDFESLRRWVIENSYVLNGRPSGWKTKKRRSK